MADSHNGPPAPGGPPSSSPGGVPADYEQFCEEHYQPAYRFAFSLSGNHSDACDLTQQAFYIAHAKRHQLREPGKAKSWLFTILHREFLRLRRQATAHPQVQLEFVDNELPLISVDHAALLDSKTVLLALQTLDENFKAPLVLFYLEQLSYKEIAEIIETPIGTVMSRLARGKQMLRKRLETQSAASAGKIVPLPPGGVERRSDG